MIVELHQYNSDYCAEGEGMGERRFALRFDCGEGWRYPPCLDFDTYLEAEDVLRYVILS